MKRLLVCDLDNTLLKGSYESSWQLIWDFLAVDPEVRRYGLEQYYCGGFSYPEWCAHDARIFREHGLKQEHFTQICAGLRPAPGLAQTLDQLQEQGIKMAIVSGALDRILHTALPWYDRYFDHAFVNQTIFDEHGVLQTIIPTRHDFEGKLRCVKNLCAEYDIPADQAVFVGDGPNDLSLAGEVGLTIAFGSRCQAVKEAFDLDLPDDDFTRILPFFQPGHDQAKRVEPLRD